MQKLKLWYILTAMGLIFVAAMTGAIIAKMGTTMPETLVGVATVLTAFTMTVIPLAIGFGSGYSYARDD